MRTDRFRSYLPAVYVVIILAILVTPVSGIGFQAGTAGNTGESMSASPGQNSTLPITGCVPSNPRADFSMHGGHLKNNGSNGGGMAPLMMQFTDQSTGAVTWSWDFGDGSPVSPERDPGHTYPAGSPEGTSYDVTLTVTGSCPGETNTTRKSSLVTVFDDVGFLFLTSNPEGATVTIDGRMYPGLTQKKTYEPVPLVPGNHTVHLTLTGYEDYTATVTIVDRTFTQILPVLKRDAAVSSSSPSGTALNQINATEGRDEKAGGGLPAASTISQTVLVTGSSDKGSTVSLTGRKIPGFSTIASIASLASGLLILQAKRKNRYLRCEFKSE